MTAAAAATQSSSFLQGKRVLLIEDNFLNGLALQGALERMGCKVIGPFASVEQGTQAVSEYEIDIAILDINIVGGVVTPIAELLRQRNCSFLFVTGYASPHNLPEWTKSIPRLRKPVNELVLQKMLLLLLQRPDNN